jgi:hypothetical protein
MAEILRSRMNAVAHELLLAAKGATAFLDEEDGDNPIFVSEVAAPYQSLAQAAAGSERVVTLSVLEWQITKAREAFENADEERWVDQETAVKNLLRTVGLAGQGDGRIDDGELARALKEGGRDRITDFMRALAALATEDPVAPKIVHPRTDAISGLPLRFSGKSLTGHNRAELSLSPTDNPEFAQVQVRTEGWMGPPPQFEVERDSVVLQGATQNDRGGEMELEISLLENRHAVRLWVRELPGEHRHRFNLLPDP